MKKLITFIALLAITASAAAQIKVLSNGNVGIAGAHQPNYKVDIAISATNQIRIGNWINAFIDLTGDYGAICFYPEIEYNLHIGKSNKRAGNVYTHNIWSITAPKIGSDERIKENIHRIENPIAKIKQISGYYYNLKRDFFSEHLPEGAISDLTKKQIGFLAQEVEREFPELVIKPKSEDEFYSLDYTGMLPVLLEAIKEQQTQIEELQVTVSKQSNEILFLKEQLEESFHNSYESLPLENTPAMDNYARDKGGKLFQNVPNPFSVNTTIKFEISENSSSAKLLIHDMQGAEVKSYLITTKGSGNLIIQGSELQAGMYMYTLLVNNTIIDSKRMILTK
jgi:hypothetical protein